MPKKIFARPPIFAKIFIPIIIIMLVQVGIINIFLFAGGTIESLDNSAINMLAANVQNRASHLEDMMVHYWSNVDGLEHAVSEGIGKFLAERGVALEALIGDAELEIELLGRLAPSLLDALRVTAATGVFMYFLSGEDFDPQDHAAQRLNGLYYRNFSPLLNVHLDSLDNVILVRGHVDIARQDGIQLDSIWNEYFIFDPQCGHVWRGFAYPQIAAAQFPGASAIDLSYWNRPHYLNPASPVDANKMITYTRPVFFQGRLVAMIGTEVQMTYIERRFPARDFANWGDGGYMLMRYDAREAYAQSFKSDIFRVTGAFMNRLMGGTVAAKRSVTLAGAAWDGVCLIDDYPEVLMVRVPLRLYNSHAPFAHEQWALAAIGTEASLFEMSRNVNAAVFFSTVFACVIGGLMLFFIIKSFTKPINSIINQLKGHSGDTPIRHKPTAYEIDMLCDTINGMITRREAAESQIREERQRYLLALESSADTFVEYDAAQDTLAIYYFTQRAQQTPESKIIANFTAVWTAGGFFHPDDVRDKDPFGLLRESAENYEVRINSSVFSHIKNKYPDNGYYWFALKTILFPGADGAPVKIIGTAKEITLEKLKERAAAEASRRDLTTGLYGRAYGLEIIRKEADAAANQGRPFGLSLLRVNNFELMEANYGLIFGGIFMAQFSQALARAVQGRGFAVRLGNDEFLLLHDGTQGPEKITGLFDALYFGERPNSKLSLRIESLDGLGQIGESAPVSISLDLGDKDKLNELALELFERTAHIRSSIGILLRLLGGMFALDRIIICNYDEIFGTNQVAYQWHAEGAEPHHTDIKKVSQEDFERFKSRLGESGTLLYSSRGESGDTLLCAEPGRKSSGYCCIIYENAAHAGRILFVSHDPDREWPESDKNMLHNMAKVIATYISVERSRSASRAKSQFLSRISHEIRTPMNAIMGMTDMALNHGDNPELMGDCLEKIGTSANYLLSLINDVLEMSRIESGRLLQIDNRAFSLSGLVREIDNIIRFAIENNGLSFKINASFRHDLLVSDASRLKQVILNLLGNANKFTEPGGSISFTIEESAGEESDGGFAQFKFSVKDTGIGIPPDKQAAIFRPFEQANTLPNVGAQQGTGLGLSISSHIISAMGGKIDLKSAPHEGSEFYFTLSLQLGGPQGVPEAAARVSYDFAGKRLLVVDDVEVNVDILAFNLENAGFKVETARNGREALDKFFGSPPAYYSAILMDIQMPVMDGMSATRAIRGSAERRDAQTVPIIAVTANAFDEDLHRSIESGMNGHVSKPVKNEELFAVLHKFI